MNQPSLFSAARAARDDGVAKTSAKNSEWMERALDLVTSMKGSLEEFTGEMLRMKLRAAGLSDPSKPHAWGALTITLVKKGVIVDTGKVSQMFTEKSHARRTPVWRFA